MLDTVSTYDHRVTFVPDVPDRTDDGDERPPSAATPRDGGEALPRALGTVPEVSPEDAALLTYWVAG